MSELLESFHAWSTRRKLAFGAGVLVIVLLASALGWWAYTRPRACCSPTWPNATRP